MTPPREETPGQIRNQLRRITCNPPELTNWKACLRYLGPVQLQSKLMIDYISLLGIRENFSLEKLYFILAVMHHSKMSLHSRHIWLIQTNRTWAFPNILVWQSLPNVCFSTTSSLPLSAGLPSTDLSPLFSPIVDYFPALEWTHAYRKKTAIHKALQSLMVTAEAEMYEHRKPAKLVQNYTEKSAFMQHKGPEWYPYIARLHFKWREIYL